ncbi:hypothetical protein ACHAWF_010651 [Thalassiosira exigua]
MLRCILPALLCALSVLPTATAFASPQSSPLSCRSIRVYSSSRRLGASSSSPSVDAISTPTADTTNAASETFASPSFRVYIEDTDAYGVMYNGNYLRSYERALSHVERDYDDGGASSASGAPSSGYPSGGWVLSRVTDQKFRSSPALGEEYVVRGELMTGGGGDDADYAEGGVDAEVWRLEMVTKKSDGEDDWVVHNSATATLTRAATEPAEATAATAAPSATSSQEFEMGKMIEHSFVPYRDEFDFHHRPHIPIRSALNYFERSRSSYLGGPDALRRMQEEDDLLWVVTGIDDGELFLSDIALECFDDDTGGGGSKDGKGSTAVDWHPAPGKEVTVQTNFVARHRGMIVDCRHSLLLDVKGERGTSDRRLLARATVTIMALKGSTRRPTSKLPGWLLEKLMADC